MATRAPWLHAAALVLVLGVAFALSERSTGFTVDEGSYAIQAAALRDGSWEIDWPFRGVDPDAEQFPYHAGTVTGDAEYAYVSHPAWPVVLWATTTALPEEVGLRLPSMLAVVAAAFAGAHLAARLGGERARWWGFWIVAASPLLADGLMSWAHAPAAALAGWAAVAALELTLRERPASRAWWVVLAGTVAAGVLLRSESVLLAGALALALGVLGILRRRRSALLGAVVVGLVAAVAHLVERAWVDAIVGSGGPDTLDSRAESADGWLQGRLDGAGAALLDGAASSRVAALCSAVALALVAGAVVVRLRRSTVRAAPLLWGAAALTGVRLLVAIDEPASGLLAAWPVGVLAVLALAPRDDRIRLLAGVVVVFVGAVLLTQYDDGGGLQWGGRYLAPAIVPVGALAAVAVGRHLREVDHGLGGGAPAALAMLLAAGGVLGLVVTDQLRQRNADALAALDRTGAPTVLVAGDHLARLDWASWPERCWVSADPAEPEAGLAVLRAAGEGRSAFLGFVAPALADAGTTVSISPESPAIGTLDADAAGVRACPGRGKANVRSPRDGGR